MEAIGEKLQKVLARAGLGSRREIEQWIAANRIIVNGHIAKLGDRVNSNDKIQVDGKLITIEPQDEMITHLLMYHKPSGEICTRHDPEGRNTVFDRLPKLDQGKWISIGRLDLNTSGLLLLTNNGELANYYMHPKNKVEREYAVRILGTVEEKILQRLTEGVQLEDGFARFEHIVDSGGEGANHWYHVVIAEGRNRLVRRLWESQNLVVSRLIRVRFGPILMPRNLKQGEVLEISPDLLQNPAFRSLPPKKTQAALKKPDLRKKRFTSRPNKNPSARRNNDENFRK